MNPEEERDSREAVDPLAQSPYYLDSAQSKEIFEADIAPFLFAHGEARQRPCAVVVIAQPGAGKTAMAQKLREDFAANGDAVSVEVDGLKPFHPDLATLQRDVGEVAADEFVQADARRWQEMAMGYLVERRVNVIIEQFPRNLEMLSELSKRFAEAGYDVRAALLTTPLAQSMQGVLLRYQQGHEHGGGRDVPQDKQEERFQQLPKIVDWLQADPMISGITLYRRTGTVVHENMRDALGQWGNGSSRTALEDERLRPWDVLESEEFLSGQVSLTDRMGPDWTPRIEAASEAAQGLLHPALAARTCSSRLPTPAVSALLDVREAAAVARSTGTPSDADLHVVDPEPGQRTPAMDSSTNRQTRGR